MIKLSESALPAPPEWDGSKEVINLDLLENRLKKAFLDLGHYNPEFCRDIIATVREYIESARGSGQILALTEINDTVVRILCNTGFSEVASKFRGEAKYLEINYDDMLVHISESSLQEIFDHDPFFVDKPINKIINYLVDKLPILGFAKIPETLLLALAKNVYIYLISGQDIDKCTQNRSKIWVIHPKTIQSFLDAKEDSLFRNGVISINPISMLFPAVKIEIDLSKLIEEKPGIADLFELKFYPLFDRLCKSLKNIIIKLLSHIRTMGK